MGNKIKVSYPWSFIFFCTNYNSVENKSAYGFLKKCLEKSGILNYVKNIWFGLCGIQKPSNLPEIKMLVSDPPTNFKKFKCQAHTQLALLLKSVHMLTAQPSIYAHFCFLKKIGYVDG